MSVTEETDSAEGRLTITPLPDGGERFEARCPSWKRGIAGDPLYFAVSSCMLLLSGGSILAVFLPELELLGAIVVALVCGSFSLLCVLGLIQVRRAAFTAEMREGHLVYTDHRPYAPGAGRVIDTAENRVVKWKRAPNGIILHFDEAIVWGYELRRRVRIAGFLRLEEMDELEAALREHLFDLSTEDSV